MEIIRKRQTGKQEGGQVIKSGLIQTFWTFVCLYAAYGAIAVGILPYAIYPFDQLPFRHPAAIEKTVDLGDTHIPVTIFPANDGADVIFYLQGNIASRSYFLDTILAHNRAGYWVVTMQWPGSEGREGHVSESTLKEEALEVMNTIPDMVNQAEPRVHIHGYSMGSGIASYVAAHSDPDSLVLQSGYSSLCEIMTRKSMLPACYLPGVDTWDNRHLTSDLDMPILQLHGERDTLISIEYGERLSDALTSAGNKPLFVRYPDVGHVDFGGSGYLQDIHDFLDEVSDR